MSDELQYGGEMVCPVCAARLRGHRAKIEWNDQKREFVVSMKLKCVCGHEINPLVKEVPVQIAQQSRCACGAQLVLGNYTMKKTGADFEFDAVYRCDRCGKKKKTLLANIFRGFREFWTRTKRVEVGPEGLKYEKE